MKVYIKSTVGTNSMGVIGKGWQDAKLIAARENVPVSQVETLFKSLIACGGATTEDQTTPAPAATPKKTTAKKATKTTKAKTATSDV